MTDDEIIKLAESMGIDMRPRPALVKLDDNTIGFRRPEGLHYAGQRVLEFAREVEHLSKPERISDV